MAGLCPREVNGQCALVELQETTSHSSTDSQSSPPNPCLPSTSLQRQQQSALETSIDIANVLSDKATLDGKKETVLYLAYGSNLSAETFKGRRGIQPLSQLNVLVPSLSLTFDLPGIPYTEPCFANTSLRNPSQTKTDDNHKDRWHKGLVGVVYEVTLADYAVIIATEGGGASYQDITVDCFEIPAGTKMVDPKPTTAPFKAHTLFSPQLSGEPGHDKGRISRPDPSYAQASARYLKLITDGAEEHGLPTEYKEYLYSLRPYTITSTRQFIGRTIFQALWMPIILAIFAIGKSLADDKGRAPAWWAKFTNFLFAALWISYDAVFKKVFGDGERTQKVGEEDVEPGNLRFFDEKHRLLEDEIQRRSLASPA